MSLLLDFLLFAEYPNLSLPQVWGAVARRPSLRGQYLPDHCWIFIFSKSWSPLTPEAGVRWWLCLVSRSGVWPSVCGGSRTCYREQNITSSTVQWQHWQATKVTRFLLTLIWMRDVCLVSFICLQCYKSTIDCGRIIKRKMSWLEVLLFWRVSEEDCLWTVFGPIAGYWLHGWLGVRNFLLLLVQQ